MSLLEMPTLQHTSTNKNQEYQDLYDSFAVMLREMQREVNTGHAFESRLHIDYCTNNHPTQLHAAIGVVALWLSIHGERQSDPESRENFGQILFRLKANSRFA